MADHGVRGDDLHEIFQNSAEIHHLHEIGEGGAQIHRLDCDFVEGAVAIEAGKQIYVVGVLKVGLVGSPRVGPLSSTMTSGAVESLPLISVAPVSLTASAARNEAAPVPSKATIHSRMQRHKNRWKGNFLPFVDSRVQLPAVDGRQTPYSSIE